VSLLGQILDSTRSAALMGGLRRVTRIQIDIGREARVVPESLVAALTERFRGDLLGRCRVEYQLVEGPDVRVQCVEGIPIFPDEDVA